jgi:hypothetical protein
MFGCKYGFLELFIATMDRLAQEINVGMRFSVLSSKVLDTFKLFP